MKAFLLCAGRGTRFRPVSEFLAKPLLPFLNVPLAVAHLRRLERHGIESAGVNLHHLGAQVERRIRETPFPRLEVSFFSEPRILGTAGALRNAADWLGTDDFLLVNSDAALEPDFARLEGDHRRSGRPATLLVTENREPERFTPLSARGDRLVAIGSPSPDPLLYTGVCMLSGRLVERIPAGETSLVKHLWQPLLSEEPGAIGLVRHEGPFADLGRPEDFLRATHERLAAGGPFPDGSGPFEPARRVLSRTGEGADALASAIGDARIGADARIVESAVWDGVTVGRGAVLTRCLAAGGRIPGGVAFTDALLWSEDPATTADVLPLSRRSAAGSGGRA